MNILVTGVTRLKELQQLDGIGIDFAGMELKSGAGMPEGAADWRDGDFELKKTGLFELADHAAVLEAIDELGLEVVVLYEDAEAGLCSDLSSEVEVVKAFQIDGLGEKEIAARIAPFDEVCDYYLFLSEQNNWSVLDRVKVEKPFFIGGDIGPGEIGKLSGFRHPDAFGVLVSLEKMASSSAPAMAGVLQFKKLLNS
jgi:phosphoribosylanthranilate isomerase